MTAPTYFTGNVDYTGFYLHHCVHYMDLVRYYVAPVATCHRLPQRDRARQAGYFTCTSTSRGAAIGTVVMGTLQSRGTPMERLQIMGDHQRVEVNGVIEVNYFRDPPFKADKPDATLVDGVDTMSWKPNFTAAANEDFKGYNALFDAFFASLDGQATDLPTIHDGVHAMRVLEALVTGVQQPGTAIAVATP